MHKQVTRVLFCVYIDFGDKVFVVSLNINSLFAVSLLFAGWIILCVMGFEKDEVYCVATDVFSLW